MATGYAGYTQGLEDSGIAVSSAVNRGAILPDARTWQADTGVRFQLTPQVKLIAGVFEIEKPYFNLDNDNVARQLGLQRASGLEVSLTGDVLTNLRVTAAMLWGDIKVIGPDLRAEGVGTVAFNQTRFLSSINASYQLPRLPAVSADISVFSFGRYPASLDDVAQGAAETLINLGGRYRFTIAGARATLRLQIQNLTNLYFWNLGFGGPGFSQYQPRAVFGYLTADF